MARVVTSGFELNSATAGVEFDGISAGTPSIVTSPVHNGSYALQVSPSSAQTAVRYNLYSSNQSNKIYVRAWVNIGVMPSSATVLIGIDTVTSTQLGRLEITSGGKLQLQNSSGTSIGSVSAALSTNTWYCLELSLDSSVNNGTVEGRINGVVFSSAAGNATAGAGRVIIGVSLINTTATITFDDIAINDNTGSAQTGYPGLGIIARATPNAAGDSNTFLTQVGGTAGSANNYTRVNEVTPDGTTSYNANITVASDLFGVSVPTIPAGSTINCVVVGGQFANLTGADATASFQWQIEKTGSGTISKSAAIIPNSTTMTVNKGQAGVSAYPLTLYNDPDGNPWTPTTIASMQIGYLMNTTNVDPIAISTVWALVDYTPPSNPNDFFSFF